MLLILLLSLESRDGFFVLCGLPGLSGDAAPSSTGPLRLPADTTRVGPVATVGARLLLPPTGPLQLSVETRCLCSVTVVGVSLPLNVPLGLPVDTSRSGPMTLSAGVATGVPAASERLPSLRVVLAHGLHGGSVRAKPFVLLSGEGSKPTGPPPATSVVIGSRRRENASSLDVAGFDVFSPLTTAQLISGGCGAPACDGGWSSGAVEAWLSGDGGGRGLGEGSVRASQFEEVMVS